ncbi:TfoX/Sxy family protein [Dokdonella sp.]|uniref:TfoX/Sxy family protein n=1 Tax=Dokdonella sp. TaxID=2291710 RepID=UPI001B0CCE44|nr:TfoX/Sxy family protein [Dokdonella sp.]MBO9661961.1 TfoX/Sxy family protein [Dokdonella sp.]
MSSRDTKIRNVGPKSAAWLRQVGVRTTEDLARIGPVEAFLKVKRAGFRPSLNLLYSMAGALADCHWAELPEEQKQELLLTLDAAESANPIRTRWEKQKAASEPAVARSTESDGANEMPASNLFDDPDGGGSAHGDADRDLSRFD